MENFIFWQWVGHIGMQIFSFIVLSVIIAHHSVLTPHNVRELELIELMLKDQSMKMWGPPACVCVLVCMCVCLCVCVCVWVAAELPSQNLEIY